ncbi:MAG: GspH/FimT family protein [Comamonadaceae bacterium]|jgi:type IV fimbrial biogenesis protein FimT|nr:GspH/FimT family protein [Comamonadaceae bacterium]
MRTSTPWHFTPHGTMAVGGLTLPELLIAMAILALLAAVALPSFTALLERWRVHQTAQQLQSTLHYARSEAIRRSGRVVIQKLPNHTNGCTSASTARDWDCGWIVCEDRNGDGSCGATEPVLQRIDTPARVQVARTGGSASIAFNRWGLVSGPWLGFTLIPLDKTVSHPGARGVCMSSGGRVRIISQEAIPCTG